jgi:hypothetical protein
MSLSCWRLLASQRGKSVPLFEEGNEREREDDVRDLTGVGTGRKLVSVLGGNLDTLAGELLEGEEVKGGRGDDDLCKGGEKVGGYRVLPTVLPQIDGKHADEGKRGRTRRTSSLNIDISLVELVNELGEGREVTVHCTEGCVSCRSLRSQGRGREVLLKLPTQGENDQLAKFLEAVRRKGNVPPTKSLRAEETIVRVLHGEKRRDLQRRGER